MRTKKIIYGNWKMNHGLKEAENFLNQLAPEFKDMACVKGIAPQAPLLHFLKKDGMPHHILVGAQNSATQDTGALTGEVSPQVLAGMRIDFIILGHSERRQIFCESDEIINKKVRTALPHGIQVVFCLGETLEQRQAGKTLEVLKQQLTEGLKGTKEDLENYHNSSLVIAYEPVWAIGTGEVATEEQAQEAHAFIRQELNNLGLNGQETAILYGGSVKPDNAEALLGQPDIDGALVGGASLEACDFVALCRIASSA